MKRFFKKLGFAFLCVFLFIISVGASFLITNSAMNEAPYDYLRVPEDPSVWTVTYNVESDGRESTKYDLYLPANVDDTKNYSLILYIHGGGFTGGDKSDGSRWCPYYASEGIVAVSVNYTLSELDGVTSINTMIPELRQTVSAIKDHCAKLGYNITEMATTGHSAGGCLALLYAYKEPEKSSIPVKFVFELAGPVSFEPEGWSLTDNESAAAFIASMSGIDLTANDVGSKKYQNAIDSISPAAYVNENTVPTLLGYGARDTVVPAALKYALVEKLEEYGADYDFIDYSNSGHWLLHDIDKSEEFYKKMDEYIELYFENCKQTPLTGG